MKNEFKIKIPTRWPWKRSMVGIKITALTWILISEKAGVSMDKIETLQTDDKLKHLIWAGIETYAMYHKKNCGMPIEKVEKFIKRLRVEELTVIAGKIKECEIFGKRIADHELDLAGNKKKIVKSGRKT